MRSFDLFAVAVLTVVFSAPALAQIECEGSLKQEHFYPEIKELNRKIQDNIITGRKLEESLRVQQGSAQAAEHAKRLTAVKAELQTQKKEFELLNSPLFPPTDLIGLGAACTDLRWVDHAKGLLLKHPENLGKRYYVWLDKETRELRAAQLRPGPGEIGR